MVEKFQRPEHEQLKAAHALSIVAAIALFTSAASAEVLPAATPGHVQEPDGLYQGALHGYTPNTVKGGTVIDTVALAKLIDEKHPVLLDVAEGDRKPPGMGEDMLWLPTHRSIAGSVFLQGGGNGTSAPGYGDAFKTRVSVLTGNDKAKPIVTFCHPDCWGSYNAARRLAGLGYTQVYWYRDGVEGWQSDHDTVVARPDAAWLASIHKEATP